MPELTLQVCNITFLLESRDGEILREASARYAPFAVRGRPDLRLRVEPVEAPLRAEMEEPRVTRSRGSVGVERHDLELRLTARGGSLRLVRAPSALDSSLRIALSFALGRRGGFLCHSAAVEGWLFPGVSGAGKSTLGLAAPPERLLADELVGVTRGRLHGTPFWGDFRAGRNRISRRLEAILLLDRTAPRGVRPAGKAEALARILQCALCFSDDAATAKRILAVARHGVERAPTFVLSYDARVTDFMGVERMIREALA